MRLNNLIKQKVKWILKNKFLTLALSISLVLFLVSAFHEDYPDEYDSILGGKYILEGRIPYKDWFQHHQPGAYVLASFLLLLSGPSFVGFRVMLALYWFFSYLLALYIIRKRAPDVDIQPILWLMVLLPLGSTYFWGQMLLADTLAANLLLPPFMLLVYKHFSKTRFSFWDAILVCWYSFLVWFTSITYIFPVAFMTAYVVFAYFRNSRGNLSKELWRFVTLLILPYALFFMFFFVTGGLDEWYFGNITYNQNYYIDSYPKEPGKPLNPVRHFITMTVVTIANFYEAFQFIPGLSLKDPLVATLSLSVISLGILLLIKRKYSFLLVFVGILLYVNARSNPSSSLARDYQASAYLLLSLFSGLFSFRSIWLILEKKIAINSMIIYASLILLLSFYLFGTSYFFLKHFTSIFYPKYMGQMPLIYDRPEIAPMLNSIVHQDEFAWIGPFNFKENFYGKYKQPSRYHWFLSQIGLSKEMQNQIIEDFSSNKPVIVVFQKNVLPFGGNSDYYKFFTDYLKENYLTLSQINAEGSLNRYDWIINSARDHNFNEDVYILKSQFNEIIGRLVSGGYVKVNN